MSNHSSTHSISEGSKDQNSLWLESFVKVYLDPILAESRKSLLPDLDRKIDSPKSLVESLDVMQNIKRDLRNEITKYFKIEDIGNDSDSVVVNTIASRIQDSWGKTMAEIITNQKLYEHMEAHIKVLEELANPKVMIGFLVKELHRGSTYRLYDQQIQLKKTDFCTGLINSGNVSNQISEYAEGYRVTTIENDLPLVRGKLLYVGQPKLFAPEVMGKPRKKPTNYEIQKMEKTRMSVPFEMVLIPGKYDLVIEFDDEPLMKLAEIITKFGFYKYLINRLETIASVTAGYNWDSIVNGDYNGNPNTGHESETRADLLILDSLFKTLREKNKAEEYHFILGRLVNKSTETVKKYLGFSNPRKLKNLADKERGIQKEAAEIAVKKIESILESLNHRLAELKPGNTP